VPASLKISALAVAVAATAALTSCSTGGGSSSSSAASSSPASASPLKTLKQQAQHEHGLVIYANIPGQYFQPVIAVFNKQYPFVKVSVADLSDNVVFSKYEAEAAQG